MPAKPPWELSRDEAKKVGGADYAVWFVYRCTGYTDVAEAAWLELCELRAEIERMKRGDFTADEIHGFCHKLQQTVPLAEFRRGCEEYQRKLYALDPADSPDTARYVHENDTFTLSTDAIKTARAT